MRLGGTLRAWANRFSHSLEKTEGKGLRNVAGKRLDTAVRAAIESLEKRTMLTATPLYWDPNGAATASGGTGTWDTSTAEWRSGSPTGSLVTWNNAGDANGPYQAIFPGTGGTITLGASVSVVSMAFTVDGYSINGSSTNLVSLTNGIGQIDVASGATVIINAGITSNSGLTKTNSGALGLTGTLSGTSVATLNIEAGTLVNSGAESWQTVEVGISGSLAVQGATAALIVSGSITVDGTVVSAGGTIQTPTLTIDSSGIFRDASGTVSGSVGNIAINNAGTFISVTDQSLASATGSFFNSGTYEVDNASGSGTTTLSLSFTDSGTFDLAGGILSLPGSISLPYGTTMTINGTGTLDVPSLDVADSTLQQNSGTLNVATFMNIGDHYLTGATYDLAGGSVTIGYLLVASYSTASLYQSGGSLSVASNTEIGTYGTGLVDQTGGTAAFHDMYMGIGGAASYNASGGTISAGTINDGRSNSAAINLSGTAALSAYSENIGDQGGHGLLTQSGSSVNNSTYLTIGAGSTGVYNLSGGSMTVWLEWVGRSTNGSGTFTQTGGTHTVTGGMYIGNDDSSTTGQFTISGGQLIAGICQIAVNGGNGNFTQTGGSTSISGALMAGVFGGASSTLTLSGGSITATDNIYIGYSSNATFIQSGGTFSTGNILVISGSAWDGDPAGVGTYDLSGTGQSNPAYTLIGYTANGTLTQTGGSFTTINLAINGPRGTVGIYNQAGGTSSVGHFFNVLKPSISGDNLVNEGTPDSISFSASTDVGYDAISSWTVDWGDGTGGSVYANPTSHTYFNGGNNYTINATAYGGGRSFPTDPLDVMVNDVPAQIASIADQSVNTGSNLSISTTFTDPGIYETHTATIDWGDGTDTPATVTESGGSGTVSATHTYNIHGNYHPQLEITDSGGAVAILPFNVTALYVAPTLSMAGPYNYFGGSPIERQGVTLQLLDNGPETTGVTSWNIDWGDGTTQTVTSLPNSSSTSQAEWDIPHTYSGSGTFTIEATANDSAGSHALAPDTVSVVAANQNALSVTKVASLNNFNVVLNGDAGSDRFYVRWTTDGDLQLFQDTTPSSSTDPGDPIYSVSASDLNGVTINGGGGEDRLTIDYTNIESVGSAAPFGINGLTFNGGTAAVPDQINLIGGTDSTSANPDAITLNGSAAAVANSIVFAPPSGQSATVFASNSTISMDMSAGTFSLTAQGGAVGTLFSSSANAVSVDAEDGSTIYLTNYSSSEPAGSITTHGSGVVSTTTAPLPTLSNVSTGSLTLDATSSNPIPSAGMDYIGDGFTLIGPSDGASHTITIDSTSASIDGNTVYYVLGTLVTFQPGSSTTTLDIYGGLADISSDVPSGTAVGTTLTVDVDAGGNVEFDSTLHLAALNVASGGTARMAEAGNNVLVTNSLVLSPPTFGLPKRIDPEVVIYLPSQNGGMLDLTDNDLIVHGGSLDSVGALVAAGSNGLYWNGEVPIGSLASASILSDIAAADPTHAEALGAGQIGSGVFLTEANEFDNEPVTNSDVIVKFTYYGDANLNGIVGDSDGSGSRDEEQLDNGYINHLTGWTNGDFNYDGVVNGADYTLYDNMANDTWVGGVQTLAADADFPTNSLPTVLPDRVTPIASWQVDWGNGQTAAFAPGDTVSNPYSDADATYLASFEALDASGNIIYRYPHRNITITRVGPDSLTATSVSPNKINLAWTAYSSTVYTTTKIYISTDDINFTYFDSVNSDQSTYQAVGLIPNTQYYFQLTAADTNGHESTPSPAAGISTQSDPWNVQVSGPSTVDEDAQYTLSLSIDPTLSAPNFDHWVVDWGDGSDVEDYSYNQPVVHTFASGIDFSVIHVTASTAIQPEIAGTSGSSLEITTQPIPVDVIPLAPSNLQLTTISQNAASLAWTNSSQSASGYIVYRADGGGAFDEIATVAGNISNYTDNSLEHATSNTLQYKVEAFGDSQEDLSSPCLSSIVTDIPNVPALSVTEGTVSTIATMTWQYLAQDETGFVIQNCDETLGTVYQAILTPRPTDNTGMASQTINGLVEGDTYSFEIWAVHADGTTSAISTTSYVAAPLSESPQVLSPPVSPSLSVPEEALLSHGFTTPGTVEAGYFNGNYYLIYQTGGTSSFGACGLGVTANSRGELVIKGGSLAVTYDLLVGDSGYGSFTNGGASVQLGSLQIAENGRDSSESYFNQVAGSTNVSGTSFVGSVTPENNAGLLAIGGGTFTYANTMTVRGNGSTLDFQGPMVSTASCAQVSYSGTGVGLALETGTDLEFDPTTYNGSVPEVRLGNGSLDAEPGSHVVINFSNYNGPTATLTLMTYASEEGQRLTDLQNNYIPIAASGYTLYPSFTGTSLSVRIVKGATETYSPEQYGAITSSKDVGYNYAPSFMYDETDGLYKVWSLYNALGKGVTASDNVGYKEYPTLLGLTFAPTTYALSPERSSTYFGNVDVGDPTVYRDPSSINDYYMVYDGISRQPVGGDGDGSIGIAISADGGRTFMPVPGGETNGALIVPDAGSSPTKDYGVGQAAVAYDPTPEPTAPHGRWYMVYDDSSLTNEGVKETMKIISSTTADFANYTSALAPGVTVTVCVPYVVGTPGISASPGLAYDPNNNELVVVGNFTDGTRSVDSSTVTLDSFNLSAAGVAAYPPQTLAISLPEINGIKFGEGVGILTDSTGQLLDSYSSFYTFVASTWRYISSGPATNLEAVIGGLSFISGIFAPPG